MTTIKKTYNLPVEKTMQNYWYQLLDCYPKTIEIEYARENGQVGQISVEFVFKEHFILMVWKNTNKGTPTADLHKRKQKGEMCHHLAVQIDFK